MRAERGDRRRERDRLVFRPALLPENRKAALYPLAICAALSLAGYLIQSVALIVVPLIIVAAFPGVPIAIHGLFFLTVKVELRGDTLHVVDWAGDPFVKYPRRQAIALSRVAYAYHLGKEAEANKSAKSPGAPFCNTRIRKRKYHRALAAPRRAGALARTHSGLVLSDREGIEKLYVMHFPDLSRKDQRRLARAIRERNQDLTFLMSEREKKALLGKMV